MEKIRYILLGLLIVSGAAVGAEPVGRPDKGVMTKFQDALYQEQTAGDLDKAIELYQQVLAESAQVERLAARATFQLGVCYLKKGDKEKAAEYFGKVVSDYPAQKEVTNKAQKLFEQIAPAAAKPSGDYVIHYKAIDQSQDALELLNRIHPKGIRTFRANRYHADGETIDSICTDSEEGKNKLIEAINNSSDLKLVKVELLQQSVEIFKQKLEQPVSVNVARSPDGNRLTVQYAAIAIAEAAGVPYQWDKSAQLSHPRRGNYIRSLQIEGKSAAQALTELLGPIRLSYGVDGNGIYLYDSDKLRKMVEDFFSKNYRDITSRTTLEWGAPTIDEKGNISIRYKYEATIWDKDKIIQNKIFTFDNNLKFVSVKDANETISKQDKPLTLEAAPWVDGEVMRLGLATPAGMDIGEIIYTAKTEQADGAPVWVIESYMNVPISNTQQYTLVRAEAESFKPSMGITNNDMGRFSAVYGDNKVDLTVSKGDGKKTQTLTSQQTVYDNEQALYLIRRMPLSEGYSGSFYLFHMQSASASKFQIDVKGKERRTVAAGTFDCWKVTLAGYVGTFKGVEATLWFSADEHKYLVRYDSEQAIMELKEATVKSDRPAPLTFDDLGFELPTGWFAMKNPAVGGYKLGVQLIPPGMESWGLLAGFERIPMMDSARMVADMHIEQLKGFFKNYTVREQSRQDLTIDGMQVASYVADYIDEGDKVEYQAYVLGAGVYWFVFRTDKDKFDEQKPGFDAIVKSFEVKK